MPKKNEKGPVSYVEMLVTYKPEVPDPEKADLLAKLQLAGYDQIRGVSHAKFFQLKLKGMRERRARQVASEMGGRLLANPVIQDFRIVDVKVRWETIPS